MSTSVNVERLRELVLGTKALMNVTVKLSQTAQAELAEELANAFYAAGGVANTPYAESSEVQKATRGLILCLRVFRHVGSLDNALEQLEKDLASASM